MSPLNDARLDETPLLGRNQKRDRRHPLTLIDDDETVERALMSLFAAAVEDVASAQRSESRKRDRVLVQQPSDSDDSDDATREAANSIANGIPSRRRQTSTTAAA